MVLLLVLAACPGKAIDDSAPPIYGTGLGPGCGGTPPSAVALELTNGGMRTYEGEDWPSTKISLLATDDDGDLEVTKMDFWWDPDPDGELDTGEARAHETVFSNADTPCVTFEGTWSIYLQVGTALEYNTLYDFAARIADATELWSGILVTTASTPRSDGRDGDGTGR